MVRELCCDDILQNILHRLPAKDLMELKPVCKSWKRIIEDPLFVKYHTKHQQSQSAAAASILIRNNNGGKLYSLPIDQPLHYNPTRIIPLKPLIRRGLPLLAELPAPSCNGLILISHPNFNKSWAIWNPLTQDSHEIPSPALAEPRIDSDSASFSFYIISCGLGYDEASDDYKVVCVGRVSYSNKANSYHEKAMIYSLKLRCWRVMKKSFPNRDDYIDGDGVFLNGALHWKSWRDDKVFVLHLGREDHHIMAVPPRPPASRRYPGWENLDALDGCLMMSYKDSIKSSMDVWVMKDYGNKVWTKLLSVVDPNLVKIINMRVVAYLKSKGHVFWQHGNTCWKWRHLQTNCEKKIAISISISISNPGDGGVRDTRARRLCFGQLFPGSLVRLDGTNNTLNRKRKTEMKLMHGLDQHTTQIN